MWFLALPAALAVLPVRPRNAVHGAYRGQIAPLLEQALLYRRRGTIHCGLNLA
jgi:hypothetical protein